MVAKNIYKFSNDTIDTITDFSITVPIMLEKDKLEQTLINYRNELREATNIDYMRIDVINQNIYKLENKGEAVGLGRYESLDGKTNLESLCEKIKLKLNMDHIRVVGDLNTKIKKVAVVTGAGSDMVSLAKSKNCDVIITGDVKYHEAQDALDMGMSIVDCGHFDTEDIFKDVMKRFLDTFEDVETVKTEVCLNPFKMI